MAGVQERTVNVWDDKIKAHVKVAGSGPALVFLHGGWGPQWTAFHDTLARDFTVYAPDHPGTSDGDPESHRSLDDMWDLYYDSEEDYHRLLEIKKHLDPDHIFTPNRFCVGATSCPRFAG